MAHAIDFTTGKAAIAYRGEVPWHGYGQALEGNDLLEWQRQAGLDWEAKVATVKYDREVVDFDGSSRAILVEDKGSRVIYRSDTGLRLGIHSSLYKPVQPREVLEFYRELVDSFGYQLETAGSLKDGRKIWALASCKDGITLMGQDRVNAYLLLATSFDGTMATQARGTSVRVVCNNTLTFAVDHGRPDVSVPHTSTFDAEAIKRQLQIGEAWAKFSAEAEALAKREVSKEESFRFILATYMGLENKEAIAEAVSDEDKKKRIEKLIDRLEMRLHNGPGSLLRAAQNSAWGLLNAVTGDIDHEYPARNQGNRLNSAWFGPGEQIKRKAMKNALALVA